jgi:hypothetical protein
MDAGLDVQTDMEKEHPKGLVLQFRVLLKDLYKNSNVYKYNCKL